ncbi:MAG: hypothetical protein JW786_06265 [Desulfobacterales bacterium]|nr:hypothetical protein [Desulfobacterales bacterium]
MAAYREAAGINIIVAMITWSLVIGEFSDSTADRKTNPREIHNRFKARKNRLRSSGLDPNRPLPIAITTPNAAPLAIRIAIAMNGSGSVEVDGLASDKTPKTPCARNNTTR